jgi:hypothetical protein
MTVPAPALDVTTEKCRSEYELDMHINRIKIAYIFSHVLCFGLKMEGDGRLKECGVIP